MPCLFVNINHSEEFGLVRFLQRIASDSVRYEFKEVTPFLINIFYKVDVDESRHPVDGMNNKEECEKEKGKNENGKESEMTEFATPLGLVKRSL